VLEAGVARRRVLPHRQMAEEQMTPRKRKPVIRRSPEILSGTPVFVGTRVPVKTLIDYLEAGDRLEDFLQDFPTVTREQAVAALEIAKEALVQDAGAA
jgi:uncharacterized protein (DUF433 family)